MPLSIISLKIAATSANQSQSFQFTGKAVLVGAEAGRSTSAGVMSIYLRNSGTVQVCHIPISHYGPSKMISEDIKIPVDGKQELIFDYEGCSAGETLEAKLMFYIKDGSEQRMGWWQ